MEDSQKSPLKSYWKFHQKTKAEFSEDFEGDFPSSKEFQPFKKIPREILEKSVELLLKKPLIIGSISGGFWEKIL